MKIRRLLFPALALGSLAAALPASATPPAYIALGDSYAYGFTTVQDLITAYTSKDTATLSGYDGYVKPYSQFLGLSQANVFNLALPGETLSSFLGGKNSSQPINPNYNGTGATSQSALLADTLAREGGSVQDITIQLGGNDLIGLALSPTFQTANAATKQLLISSALTTFNANYIPVLENLKATSPSVSVLGYFDPFTPLGTGKYATSDPFNGLGAILVPELNSAIAADAAQAGVRYVDIAGAFKGQETTLSEDTQPLRQSQLIPFGIKPSLPDSFPDYHPNPAGYAVIAHQLEAVPESSSWAYLGIGLPLVAFVSKRRRRAETNDVT